MKHFENVQNQPIASLGIEGVNSFLQDTVSSDNPEAPITCGFFRMEKGSPLQYTYSYDECKLMLSGEMTVQEEGGRPVKVKPGDVLYFDAGTTVTFSSESSGTAFYVGQRAMGVL